MHSFVLARLRNLTTATWPDPRDRRRAHRVLRAALVLFVLGLIALPVAGRRTERQAIDRVTDELGRPRAAAALTAMPAAPPVKPDTTPASAPPTTAPPPPPPAAPMGALPSGKGMWIWQPERTEAGDASAIVARARSIGLAHLYVRTGSSWDGFYAQEFLTRLLPLAHRAGIRVYGWDFPNLRDWRADADRGLAAINYTTPSGDRIDGFAADVETPGEGTNLTPEGALAYGTALRQGVGYGYPLIAVVPRAADYARTNYPYPHVVAQFDAIAPMVYWNQREPGADVATTLDYLRRFGKPVQPIGQTYDGGPEGGPQGNPPRDQVLRFIEVAGARGATAVSFWDWQEASAENWDAIRDAPAFRVPSLPPVTALHLPPIRPMPVR